MNWKFWKKPTQEVEFWSVFDPLNHSSLDYLWPQPATNFFPDWFKRIPRNIDSSQDKPTIRKCPVFPEFMTQGYIIPMWADFDIILNADGSYNWECAYETSQFGWDWHHPDQYLNWLPEHEKNKWGNSLKAINPWRVKTPPGYSCYCFPLMYHFYDVQPLPGSIRTDIWHEINVPLVFPKHLIGKKTSLKRGDPFLWLIPFKREKLSMTMRPLNEETKLITEASNFNGMSKFDNGYKTAGQISDNKLKK